MGAEHNELRDLKNMKLPIKFGPKAWTAPVEDEGRDVWGQLEQSIRDQFPNPKRQGCPDREVLERIAYRRLSLSQAELWLEHLGSCSPCFRDFEEIRARRAPSRRLVWTSVAACFILFAVLLFKVSAHRRPSHQAHLPQSVSPATPAQLPIGQQQVATLNFEQLSSTRGIEAGSTPQHLPRAQLSISIYLPDESELGIYDVNLLVNPADRQSLASTQGPAQHVDGRTVLGVRVDLSHIDPGTYVIAFRPVRGIWQYARVEIS